MTRDEIAQALLQAQPMSQDVGALDPRPADVADYAVQPMSQDVASLYPRGTLRPRWGMVEAPAGMPFGVALPQEQTAGTTPGDVAEGLTVPSSWTEAGLMAGLGPAGKAAGVVGKVSPAAIGALADLISEAEAGKGSAAKNAKDAVKRFTDLISLRGRPTEEAVEIASKEPHLITGGKGTAGKYVGGPRDVQSKRGLDKLRAAFDEYVGQDPRGRDWYQRYREGVETVTGTKQEADIMARQEAQWSAGVSPESELGFAIKENNAALAGMPARAYRGREHEALQKYIATGDPSAFIAGKKTGQYRDLINPNLPIPPGAVGTNDFRHARNFGYTEASGAPQKGTVGKTQSQFLDYETALAVGRANATRLGGADDWTGEALQAAPWVRQKALDIMKERPGLTYEEAFDLANKSIAEFFDKHTAHATYEFTPGSLTQQLPGMLERTPEAATMRQDYARDPRNAWADPVTGRDILYGNLNIPGTGVAARVRPTIPAQGIYTPPGGATEFNPAEVARPLVGYNMAKGRTKALPEPDRAMLESTEAVRAYMDMQNAGAAHVSWLGGRPADSNSWRIPGQRMGDLADLTRYREIGARHGLGDIVDTGGGTTMTSFYPGPPSMTPKTARAQAAEIESVAGVAPQRAKVEGVYAGYEQALGEQGVDQGAMTRELLSILDRTPPALVAMHDRNPQLAQKMLDKLSVDAEYAARAGIDRESVRTARAIIGAGPGWVERLREALAAGVVLPAVAAAVLGPLAQAPPTPDS